MTDPAFGVSFRRQDSPRDGDVTAQRTGGTKQMRQRGNVKRRLGRGTHYVLGVCEGGSCSRGYARKRAHPLRRRGRAGPRGTRSKWGQLVVR